MGLPRFVNAKHRGELVEVCNRLGLVQNAAEIGVWHGGFSNHNLRVWQGQKYYMIDAWAYRPNDKSADGRISADKNFMGDAENDKNFEIAKAAVANWTKSGRAVLVRKPSYIAVKDFEDEYFDFIYVDAGHEYRNVISDLRVWWPKLKPGGMLAGDDFADSYDMFPNSSVHRVNYWGVKSAVAQFAEAVGSPFFLTFADRSHVSTAKGLSGEEFFNHDDQIPSMPELPPLPYLVRSHQFFPAWYLFK